MPARKSSRSSCVRIWLARLRVKGKVSGSSSDQAVAISSRKLARSTSSSCAIRAFAAFLRAHAEDVAQQRLDGAPQRAFGHLQRAHLLADALQHANHRQLARHAVERGADPGMRVDRVEQAQRERADRRFRRDAARGRRHRAGQDGIAGGAQQVVLVVDVPVDRARPGGQALRQRAEGQAAFPGVVEDLDRRLDDLFSRQRGFASLRAA